MMLLKTKKHMMVGSVLSILMSSLTYANTDLLGVDTAAEFTNSEDTVISSTALTELTENELADVQGQALLTMGYTAPSGSANGTSDFGFYKLGLEAEIELNANIRSLQLGCGGINGADGCDIDMENVSLSGIHDGNRADGTPYWNNGRAASSAKLTNPFIEFAVKNPNNASTREISGFRLSAESISAFLSAGLENKTNVADGIRSFSGYIVVGLPDGTPVTTKTAATKFGAAYDQMIYGNIEALVSGSGLLGSTVFSNIKGMTPGSGSYLNNSEGWGINVPSLTVNFKFPQTVIQGQRLKQLDLQVAGVPVGDVAISGNDGGIALSLNKDICVLICLVEKATFYMGKQGVSGSSAYIKSNGRLECPTTSDCSYLRGINANVRVLQNFNMVHNLPITSGGYLSLQKTAIKWPGSNSDDIAQRGWWMSFKDPLNFGALNTPPDVAIDMGPVLPQVTSYVTDFMGNNTITLGITDALNAIIGSPVYKAIGDINVASRPAVMTMENLLLDNHQAVVPNCWGNLKFC